MKFLRFLKAALLVGLGLGQLNSSHGQTKMSTEQAFQDLFITAGYSTAFGAALGTAFIGLSGKNPLNRLNYIAVGSSIGFIAGSALGAHLILNPSLDYEGFSQTSSPKKSSFAMLPVIDDRGLIGVATSFRLFLN